MIYNIRGYHGGLGDQLQFSTLPEELTKLGHEVKLYTGPDVQPFRNDEIYKFVWGHNPYVKGESKENWNCGDIPAKPYKNTTGSFIRNWEDFMGIEPKNDLPKIYYNPKLLMSDLKYGIIDLSCISMQNEYQADQVLKSAERIMGKYPDLEFYALTTKNQSNRILLYGIKNLNGYTLEDISDKIYNAMVFISLSSGLHSLAAAIQRFNPYLSQYCILPASKYDFFMNSKLFIYPNVIYIQEG